MVEEGNSDGMLVPKSQARERAPRSNGVWLTTMLFRNKKSTTGSAAAQIGASLTISSLDEVKFVLENSMSG